MATKKKITAATTTPPPPESTQMTLGSSRFILDSNLCDPYAVTSIDMPKLLFTKSGTRDEQRIKEKSTIVVSIYFGIKPGFQPLNVMNAAKNGLDKFHVKFIDNVGTHVATWALEKPKITGVDFGTLSYDQDGSEEHPYSHIKVEIEYESIAMKIHEVNS